MLRLLHLYCSPENFPAAREQLFDMVALSCMLGNGDAHMKNFGVLYDRVTGAVRMAPAYDIVCTRHYIADDNLALSLEGNRSFFAARLGVLDSLDGLARRLPGLPELIAKETQTWFDSFKRLQQR